MSEAQLPVCAKVRQSPTVYLDPAVWTIKASDLCNLL